MAIVSSSAAVDFDEGRFVPGTLLAERYRILGRLGKGGMGEVYRANDLRLGQTVALKFLPETTAKDPGMLARFYNEVRIARQVTHPNVCRVFDIGDVEGQPFISMQFVDGENLASLLLRIGRLPADKAVEISRRLCAGLAAAHSQGVLHRDLKPANIMIDGRGQVLITDFGLAGLEEEIRGADIHSGTPAYMAPEQLAGKEVTSRSDIYALGLVMYEMFTGKRAFEAETLADLVRMRSETRPSEMSSSVRDVDPSVERIILKCLDPDPAKRPSGALAVSAALPGGDPLAAALAAGETPSPEMVAAAGAQEGLKPLIAIACLAAILISLAAIVYFDCRQELAGMVNFELPPEALAVQARKTIQQFGYTAPIADRAFTFDYSGAYLYYLKQQSKQALDWPKIALSQPPVIYFSYRESPLPLEPHNFDILGRVSVDDPPPSVAGMARITLDLTGQMRSFSAVPPQVDPSPPLAQQPDATPLFTAAGLDLKSFQPTDPHWTPLASVDARAAWTGTFPNVSTRPIRVEAAWWRGKPVYFQIVGPWTQPDRMPAAPRRNDYTWIIVEGSGSILAAFMTWRNLRLGRGDRQGAIRLAAFAFCVALAEILLRAHFATLASTFRLWNEAISQALWTGGLLWLAYIALEPAVRRLWPRSLITWTRLLSGRWQDALVGRDLLIGLLVGMGYDLVFAADNEYSLFMGGIPSTAPRLDALLGISRATGVILDRILNGLLGSFLFFLLFFFLRAILRKEWLAGAAFVALFVGLRLFSSNNNYPIVDVPAMIIVYGVIVVMILRCGLLALVTTIFVTDLIGELVFTTNFSAWYGSGSLLLIIFVSALAIFAFRKSLGGHRLSAALLDQ
ncbi:MAG TPA: serine/threonine-protein kinase [Bryobacteraceae bacterium]|nr:serine/threonine-protein kinase [Bryobacteraceae bacterium]